MFLVFDYDGVVIDSLAPVAEAAFDLHDFIERPRPTMQECRAWLGPNIADSIALVRDQFDLDESLQEDMEQCFFDAYTKHARTMTTVFEGMPELLGDLAATQAPLALATMKAHSEMEAIGTPLPGIEFFEFVSAPQNHLGGKSKQQLVADAVEHLNRHHPSSAGAMIGDRGTDIEAGRSSGLTTVAVTWGFGTPSEIEDAKPDHVVETVDELRSLLLSSLLNSQ